MIEIDIETISAQLIVKSYFYSRFFDQFEFRHFPPGLAPYLAEISVEGFPRLFNKNEPCYMDHVFSNLELLLLYYS